MGAKVCNNELGDYVIKDQRGEFTIMRRAAFEAWYEEITDHTMTKDEITQMLESASR